jgi:hypothetical protein
MKTLTNRQMGAALIAIALIMIGLIAWQFTQPTNCWDNYQTEQQAIQHCERHP